MYILLPGPTPVPQPIQAAMIQGMTDHRGSEFTRTKTEVLEKLAHLFGVPDLDHVAVLPASGTGGLECVAQNFFMPGDRVLSVETGLFGQRFSEIATAQGVTVDHLVVPWGQAFRPDEILARVEAADYRAVLVTHNETATGVLNPVSNLAQRWQRLKRAPLLIVDSVSGVPSVPLSIADGVDVIIAASQKGFMCPPGLAILALSARAREAVVDQRPGRFYFDLRPYLQGHFPYTPAISLWYGLNTALDLLADEGATKRLARHEQLRDTVRAFAAAGGLTPLVASGIASPTVTALGLPEALDPATWRKTLEQSGLQIAGGLGSWSSHAIRVGHVGAVDLGLIWTGLGLMAPALPYPERALAAALEHIRQVDQGSGKEHRS